MTTGSCVVLLDSLPLVPMDPDLAERIAAASREVREAAPITAKRDALIRRAYAEGAGLRELGRAAGLTHRAVRMILDRTPLNDEESPAERP